MQKKIKIHTFSIDHWFESEQDIELYKSIYFPHLPQQTPTPNSSEPTTLWIDEAVAYLGLDRTDKKQPRKAIYRMVKRGVLSNRKISGKYVFDRAELDRVLANGDHKRGRGRPRGR